MSRRREDFPLFPLAVIAMVIFLAMAMDGLSLRIDRIESRLVQMAEGGRR